MADNVINYEGICNDVAELLYELIHDLDKRVPADQFNTYAQATFACTHAIEDILRKGGYYDRDCK